MGRKRTSKKRDLTLSVEKDLIEKLKEWEINKSLLFTAAAKEIIDKLEKENSKKIQK